MEGAFDALIASYTLYVVSPEWAITGRDSQPGKPFLVTWFQWRSYGSVGTLS
jgi:hypothetical protein